MAATIRTPFVNVRFDTVRLLVPDSIIAPESPQALLATHGAFMSEILDCDPTRGFVAFPVAIFDLDLSPGAFRTLAELCRMANAAGQCWPSLAQLGRRLGRSRASVSAYITELRTLGVLSTEEQKMANGYNYRLRYTVTFWQAWRAGLSKQRSQDAQNRPAQKPERRVQQAERPLETKNHIHKKQLCQSGLKEFVLQWHKSVGQAPYPSFNEWPSTQLVEDTKALNLEVTAVSSTISTDIEDALRDFLSQRNISCDIETLADQITPLIPDRAGLKLLISALEAEWQSHWRKPPNYCQLAKVIKSLPPAQSEATQRKLLKSYLQRWKLYQRSLPPTGITSTVAA